MCSTDLKVLKVVAVAPVAALLVVSPPSSAVSQSAAAATHSAPQLLHFLVVHDGSSFPQIRRPREKTARPGFEGGDEAGVRCRQGVGGSTRILYHSVKKNKILCYQQ